MSKHPTGHKTSHNRRTIKLRNKKTGKTITLRKKKKRKSPFKNIGRLAKK